MFFFFLKFNVQKRRFRGIFLCKHELEQIARKQQERQVFFRTLKRTNLLALDREPIRFHRYFNEIKFSFIFRDTSIRDFTANKDRRNISI